MPIWHNRLRHDPIMIKKKKTITYWDFKKTQEEIKRINNITFIWGLQSDSICWEKMTDGGKECFYILTYQMNRISPMATMYNILS